MATTYKCDRCEATMNSVRITSLSIACAVLMGLRPE